MVNPANANPHLDTCPDYASDVFADTRFQMTSKGIPAETAIAILKSSWEANNAAAKALWDQQREEERAAEEAEQHAAQQQHEAELALKEQQRLDDEREDRKKNKSKYISVNRNIPLPQGIPILPSPAIMAHLRKAEHVPLWHLTNEGLRSVANDPNDEAENSGKLVAQHDNSVEWVPIISKNTAKKVIEDQDLTMEQLCIAMPRLLQLMDECAWQEDTIEMFKSWFRAIQVHDYRFSDVEQEKRALLKYQADTRTLWHRVAKNTRPGGEIYALDGVDERQLHLAWVSVGNEITEAKNRSLDLQTAALERTRLQLIRDMDNVRVP